MYIDPRLNRNALAYCDLLHEQRRRFIMAIDEILQMVRQISFNHELYDLYICAGVEYLINPDTDELHRVRPGYFRGPHNLKTAHLQDFIPCNNVGCSPVHRLSDGEEVLLFNFQTRNLIRTYRINKCRHCFPPCQFTDLAIPPRKQRGAAMKFTHGRFAPVWNQRTMEKSLP